MVDLRKCKTGLGVLAAVAAITFSQTSSAVIANYSQDFESFDPFNFPTNLSGDGWLYFGCDIVGCYGPGGAPNGGPAFSAIVQGEGGPDQGAQQLSIYSDYNNQNHQFGFVETLVFQEDYNFGDDGIPDPGPIDSGDVGKTVSWSFDYKKGNLELDSEAFAFIKTLDPTNGFAQSSFTIFDTTSAPVDWTSGSVELTIDSGMVGHFLQYGFGTKAQLFRGSGIFYDNVNFDNGSAVIPIPAAVWLFGSGLLGLVGVARRRKG